MFAFRDVLEVVLPAVMFAVARGRLIVMTT